jgi:peptide/nickel transport system substrate-binding protein
LKFVLAAKDMLHMRIAWPLLSLALILASTACGGPGPAGSGQTQSSDGAVGPQKPLVIAFRNEPHVLEPSMSSGGSNADFDGLANGYLAYLTAQQQPVPYLAQELPSLEKGTWRLLPDGRMETTYTLKKSATWHDGAPITAHDFVFAHQVRNDREVPANTADVERRISTARALDDYTLFLDWKEPWIWAGMIHGDFMAPLPRHLLEQMYGDDKERFINGSHWRDEYVGSGPYRVEAWQPGVEIVFRAHAGFVFGKPPIDQIVTKFIGDPNTIVANLRAGTVDSAFNNSVIGFAQSKALEEANWPGTVEYWRGNPRYLEFQTRDWGNHQKAVLDVRVRRALLHSIDRQALVDGLYDGKAHVWDFWLDSSDVAFPAVDRAVTKYAFDPNRSESLLREAGWTKGPDGIARNAQGEPLSMSLLNFNQDLDVAEGVVLMGYWKAAGAPTEQVGLAPAQLSDGEFRTRFPAASFNRRSLGYRALSFTTPTPENRWSGFNYSGWSNPVVSELLPRALATVDPGERESLYVEVFKAWTDDAVLAITHLQPRPMAFARGLRGPKETWVGDSAMIWNPWEWEWQR